MLQLAPNYAPLALLIFHPEQLPHLDHHRYGTDQQVWEGISASLSWWLDQRCTHPQPITVLIMGKFCLVFQLVTLVITSLILAILNRLCKKVTAPVALTPDAAHVICLGDSWICDVFLDDPGDCNYLSPPTFPYLPNTATHLQPFLWCWTLKKKIQSQSHTSNEKHQGRKMTSKSPWKNTCPCPTPRGKIIISWKYI